MLAKPTFLYIYIYILYFFFFFFFFFFGCVTLSGDMSCVRVDRSQPITVFVAPSDLCSR